MNLMTIHFSMLYMNTYKITMLQLTILNVYANLWQLKNMTLIALNDLGVCGGLMMQHVVNQKCIEKINNFIRAGKVSSSCFSVGLRFYYWEYFKDRASLTDEEQGIIYGYLNNYVDHCDYKVSDLFIVAHYGSFKEEISFYKHLKMKEYKIVIVKVKKYKIAE
eukprot:39370_1